MFDTETGELIIRCLDGLVNNFNETILDAVRCNMDIKFIGSGASAKAVVYYITDYITKSQLKAHVAYAALELAVKKLSVYNPNETEITYWAKRLIQRCAYSMISHQEMSAQQVASYLMGFDDHFTSHEYTNIFWTSFEQFVDAYDPSPECYPLKLHDAGDLSQRETTESGNNPHNDTNDGNSDSEDEATQIQGLVLDDEITLRVNSEGDIVPKTSAIEDYIRCGEQLADVCIWDYFSRVEKVTKREDNRKHRKRQPRLDINGVDESDMSESELNPDNDNDEKHYEDIPEEYCDILWGLHFHPNPVLASKKRKRPRVEFDTTHTDSETHRQRVRLRTSRLVPVPIGPAIPCRDRDDTKEKHARLMLILFKPWKHPLELRRAGHSWSDEYAIWIQGCNTRIRKIINNMQVLHECKDARDSHFESRRSRVRERNHQQTNEVTNHMGEQLTEEAVLEHMEQIQDYSSEKISNIELTARECVQHAQDSGLFSTQSVTSSHSPELQFQGCGNTANGHSEIDMRNMDKERIWQTAYEDRKEKAKKAFIHSANNESSTVPSSAEVLTHIEGGSSPQTGVTEPPTFDSSPYLPSPDVIVDGNTFLNTEHDVDIETIATKWNLNKEQSLAFELIANRSLEGTGDPLQLIITGQGGTGKSQVIHAVTDYFKQRGQRRRMRLTSYTGKAALNVRGSTLHAALRLRSLSGRGNWTKTKSELISMWQGVDFLFIDEFSMIGCNLLYEISVALSIAKDNKEPFGGINIVFAGDFAQLPPVGSKRLYSNYNVSTRKNKRSSGIEKDILGKLLWLSIRNVVFLREIWRQKADPNIPGSEEAAQNANRFKDLLSRLREGRCTQDDYVLLSSRVIGNIDNLQPWTDTPIIVSQNETKDALNEAAAHAFAKRTGRELHYYYSVDHHGGKVMSQGTLVSHLRSLNSGVTNYRLGKIPLVIGMPVMIATNFDVENGVVNGCVGTLESVRYWIDDNGDRHATSCVVQSNDITGEPLPFLEEHEAVTIADDQPIVFTDPASKQRCTIHRTQLPILPGFAMTAHKSQGMTMEKVVVDLESCRGTESPYVMISRVKSLDGLLILRSFSKNRITRRQSEEVRREFVRLHLLELLTIIDHGREEDVASARKELNDMHLAELIGQDFSDIDLEAANADILAEKQTTVNRWIQAHDYKTVQKKTRFIRKRSLPGTADADTTEAAQPAHKRARLMRPR